MFYRASQKSVLFVCLQTYFTSILPLAIHIYAQKKMIIGQMKNEREIIKEEMFFSTLRQCFKIMLISKYDCTYIYN